jgi:hypothetical protein
MPIVQDFFATRIFGPDRTSFIAQVNDAATARQAAERAEKIDNIKKAISEADTRKENLLRTLELADAMDLDFVRSVQKRVADIKTERNRLQQDLDHAVAESPDEDNPALLDAMPFGGIKLVDLPDDLQRAVYSRFGLEITYDKRIPYVGVQVTLDGEIVNERRETAIAALAASLDPKTQTPGLIRDVRVPNEPLGPLVCRVPPVGFEPTAPRLGGGCSIP